MIKLLPCPFCDTTAVSLKKVTGGWVVQCNLSSPRAWLHKDERCEYQNVCTAPMKTPEQAAEEWNWRLPC